MKRYRAEIELWSESADEAKAILKATPLHIAIIDMRRADVTLTEATDVELQEERRRRNQQRLLIRLRDEKAVELAAVLAMAGASRDMLSL